MHSAIHALTTSKSDKDVITALGHMGRVGRCAGLVPPQQDAPSELFSASDGHLSLYSSSASTPCPVPPNSAWILQTLVVPSPKKFQSKPSHPCRVLRGIKGSAGSPATEPSSRESLLGPSNLHREAL